MNDFVSILIPCYNEENNIEQCFKCLINQTYKKLEVIVINDGSKDLTNEKIMENEKFLLKEGYKFKYEKQKNAGAAAAINIALKYVTGDYIMLYDADDILMDTAVEEKVEFLKQNLDYDMVRNNGYLVSVKDKNKIINKFVENSYEKKNEYIFEDLLLAKTNNWAGSFMVRSEALFKRLVNREILVSDYGQNLQIMLPVSYFSKCGFIDKPLMKYVIDDVSHSHTKSFKRMVELNRGYEFNRIEILKTINMSIEKKEEYIKMIQNYYHRNRMDMAIHFQDKKLLNDEFNGLKNNRAINPKDIIKYMEGNCSVLKPLINLLRKFKSAMIKFRRNIK